MKKLSDNIKNEPHKSKLLLIEDDELVARMFQEGFSRLNGFNTDIAFSGKQGLEKVEKEKPDVILLDIMLPEMSGYEVLKILKSKKETASIPVIIISSLGALPELIEKSKKIGAVDVIAKGDIPPKEIVQRVKAVLEKKL